MRQKGGTLFAQILNRIRVGEINDEDIKILSSRFINSTDKSYPQNALHIFAENYPADNHNQQMLELIQKPVVTLIAHDQCPLLIAQKDIDRALSRNRSETGDLDYRIDIKEVQE